MINTIGWGIVHSLWLGGIIAALTALLLWTLRGASAATRYWIAVMGLVLIAVAPVVTVVRFHATSPVSTAASIESPSIGKFAGAVPSSTSNLVSQPTTRTAAAQPVKTSLRASIVRIFPFIVALWIAGVLLFSLRTMYGFVWARRLVRDGTKAVSDQLLGTATRIAHNMHVRRAVRVLESSRVTVPMLVGWLQPVILLPASIMTGLTPQQIEAILAHELAHVRRNDYAVNLLQTIVETLFFYHPAAWWLSGRIREERENACDELAVLACGGDRVFYSRVLLTVEESRSDVPVLAVAANGGSLSRRIHRLLGAKHAHLDIGPKWYAGIVTVVLAIAAVGGVAHETPKSQKIEKVIGADTVVRYRGNGDLAEKMAWAEQTARSNNLRKYWIGYLIKGDPSQSHQWVHIDRSTSVSFGSGTFMSGSLRFDGDPSSVRIPGTPLRSMFGDYPANDIAIFILVDRGQTTRLHLSSYAFPFNFQGNSVLWLDRAEDSESVRMLSGLYNSLSTNDLREDVTSMIGAHSDGDAVVPVLSRWAEDKARPADIRREATEGLGRFDNIEILSLLSRVARTDPQEDVRAEAVETIGELNIAAALDTLRVLAHINDERPQREAIEALGELPGLAGLEALKALAIDPDLDSDMQAEAVESIAEVSAVPETQRLAALLEIIASHKITDVRARAAEAIGEIGAIDPVLNALERLVREDREEDVRRRAIEALSGMEGDARALKILMDIALNHADMDTRRDAVEAYMESAPRKEATAFARKIVDGNYPDDLKRAALEGLADLANR